MTFSPFFSLSFAFQIWIRQFNFGKQKWGLARAKWKLLREKSCLDTGISQSGVSFQHANKSWALVQLPGSEVTSPFQSPSNTLIRERLWLKACHCMFQQRNNASVMLLVNPVKANISANQMSHKHKIAKIKTNKNIYYKASFAQLFLSQTLEI